MTEMRMKNQKRNCPFCGAPIVSEICTYCGSATGLNTAVADMEYPVMECKEAIINFWTIGFPMIFALSFGFASLMVLVLTAAGHGERFMLLIGLPFFLISIVALAFVLRTASRYIKVKKHGERMQATVYGYMDDNVLINGRPAQIVKLLVQTPQGPRFILYQLGDTLKIYGVNDSVDIMMYENYFMICKN